MELDIEIDGWPEGDWPALAERAGAAAAAVENDTTRGQGPARRPWPGRQGPDRVERDDAPWIR